MSTSKRESEISPFGNGKPNLIPSSLPPPPSTFLPEHGIATKGVQMKCMHVSSHEEEDRNDKDFKVKGKVAYNPSTTMTLRSRELKRGGNEKLKMPEFPVVRISLTDEEIEEDFIKMTGSKPPKLPKTKKSDVHYMETLFPGFKLPPTVTPDMYDVPKKKKY